MDQPLILQDVRPTRSDAVKNRELLLETAKRLFAEQGVDAVSMSAVAQAAGVGKGTLYRHFPDKAQLLVEMLDTDQRDLQERTLRQLREMPHQPFDNLCWFLGEVLAFVNRHRELVFSLQGATTRLDHPAHLWWRQTIRGLLRQTDSTLDLDYTADMLYVMLDPRTVYYQLEAHGYTPERILDGMTQLLERLIS